MTPFSILKRGASYAYRERDWPSGTYRSLHTADKAEAQRLAAERFKEGQGLRTGSLTLRVYASRFYGPDCPHVADLLAEGRTITARSLTDQEAVVKRDLMPLAIMGRRVDSLAPKDAKSARAELIRIKGATRAAQRAFVILRTILRTAFEHDLVARDPLAGVAGIKYEAEPRADFTPEQTDAFFRRENFASEAGYCLSRLAYLTGMRRAEICALDRSQDRGWVIAVDRAFKDASFTLLGPPKWGKTREIVVTKPIRELLDWWYAKTPFVHDGRVFPMATPNFWRLEFRHALKAAGITGVVPHSLRHTLASDLADAGVDAKMIREQLGHGTEVMRDRYTHTRRARLTEAMEGAMEKIARS